MSTPAVEMAKYLTDSGVGQLGGTEAPFSVHVAGEPDKPDDVVTIYDTGGAGPDTDELDLLRPTFQVRVRCVDYDQGAQKHEQIRDLLLVGRLDGSLTGGRSYLLIRADSDLLSLGRDQSGRHQLTLNYSAIRERS